MPGLYAKVTGACRQAGFVPDVVQKDVWLMQTLVASGRGAALVPASRRNLRSRGVVVHNEVHGLSPTVELGVTWRRDDRDAVPGSFLRAARELGRGS